jgi:hypothetical protein
VLIHRGRAAIGAPRSAGHEKSPELCLITHDMAEIFANGLIIASALSTNIT